VDDEPPSISVRRWADAASQHTRYGRLMPETWGFDGDRCDAISLLDAL
jgi:hypothetical protein